METRTRVPALGEPYEWAKKLRWSQHSERTLFRSCHSLQEKTCHMSHLGPIKIHLDWVFFKTIQQKLVTACIYFLYCHFELKIKIPSGEPAQGQSSPLWWFQIVQDHQEQHETALRYVLLNMSSTHPYLFD